ncbi:MAG: Mor transcription activator family protein [Clostridia bacterium]|nr:Mor transcription activator family protein [Clostridia bacterium]
MGNKNDNKNLNGIYHDIADSAGLECAKMIFDEYRGQQVTFPVEFFNKQYIYDCIIADYNGNNIKALAVKYDYSERTIRRILKEHKSNR